MQEPSSEVGRIAKFRLWCFAAWLNLRHNYCSLLDEMKHAGKEEGSDERPVADIVSYMAASTACANGGEWEHALEVLSTASVHNRYYT